MESKGDDQLPKPSKPHELSMQDPSLIFQGLPAELINQIILRLPVKSLVQFKCVSKSWLALISSPKFVKTHLSISSNNKDCTHHRLMLNESFRPDKGCSISSLLYESATIAYDLDYPMRNCDEYNSFFGVVGSVNGLICLVTVKTNFLLWNPSIRMIKKLPTCKNFKFSYTTIHGFGYDELHDDYKLVVCSGYYSSTEFAVYIVTLNSDSWTRISSKEYCYNCMAAKSGIFVNGKLHWTKRHFDSDYGINRENRRYTSNSCLSCNGLYITSIDLVDGKWEKMEYPSFVEGRSSTFGVLGSELSIFCNYESHADLWIMKEYGVKESWTKMFTINRPNSPVRFAFIPPFFMSNRGEFLFELDSTFIIYNPKDDSTRYSKITNFGYHSKTPIIYKESLVWPFLC